MGLIKTVFALTSGVLVYGSYSAYKLGPLLPKVCRKFGNRMGLLHLYSKEFISIIKPETDISKLMDSYNKSNFASTAFQREFSRNVEEIKESAKDIIPKPIFEDPFEKFRLRTDEPLSIG